MGHLPERVTGPHTVTVLGAAGVVGSGVVHELAKTGAVRRIVASDPRSDLMRAHLIDIAESARVAGSGADTEFVLAEPGELGPCELTVVAASVPEVPTGDRADFLSANWELLSGLAPVLERCCAEGGVVLLLTNPVDIMAECLRRATSLKPERILGYSLNDSARLSMAVARELGVPPSRVSAWVLGEHGAGQVPLYGGVLVDGEPAGLTPEARERVDADVRGWFARWSALSPGRSSGWATPSGVAVMVTAMREGGVLPASVFTGCEGADHYGLAESFVTLPAALGSGGVSHVEHLPIRDDELSALAAAAEHVRRAAEKLLPE
ncbi:hypothetical protein ABZ639_07470 [Saccharomonospora sp. NPDC006951]